MKKMALYRLHLRPLYKAFFVYRAGIRYIYYRYIIAPKIKNWNHSLERKVTFPNLSIHMLTCHNDALIAAWSLASFYLSSKAIGPLTLHDDGTLTSSDKAMFKRLFPSATIVNASNFFVDHPSALDSYPTLKKFRTEFPEFQAKKLIDVFFARKGSIVLLLDSDLVWFKNSNALHEAVKRGAQDVSYVMSNHPSRVHVTYKDGTSTSDMIAECNSGVTLFHENNYDLTEVSKYIENCDYKKRLPIFSDQACFGTVLKHIRILPRNEYLIKGEINNDVVMRHFTGPSREKFYFFGVKKVYKKILNHG